MGSFHKLGLPRQRRKKIGLVMVAFCLRKKIGLAMVVF
jgi:hypothetical protein